VETWIGIAERFGLPVLMLLGMSWSGVQLFRWLSDSLLKQIQSNAERIEAINIKLIDAINGLRSEIKELKVKIEGSSVGQKTIIDVMAKLSGNGLKK
tara:strand:- start:33 stop:323 length:291 start_codon:yes stop_codon:yes gene_type:complete